MSVNKLVFFALLLAALINARRNLGEIGVTDYLVRMTNFTECPSSISPVAYDIQILQRNFRQYISMGVNFTKDITLKGLRFQVFRCREHLYACENFADWNFTNICAWSGMKNQLWSNLYESVEPSSWMQTCPLLKKGIYIVHNTTIDADKLLKYFPEGYKFEWKFKSQFYSTSGDAVGCIYATGNILKYTKRSRSDTNAGNK